MWSQHFRGIWLRFAMICSDDDTSRAAAALIPPRGRSEVVISRADLATCQIRSVTLISLDEVMDIEIEELRRRGLITVLELRTLGDTELDRLLRPHKIHQIEAVIATLTRCAENPNAESKRKEAAQSAIAEIRLALAQCLDRLARIAMASAPKMRA
jgi:hypothetical protein